MLNMRFFKQHVANKCSSDVSSWNQALLHFVCLSSLNLTITEQNLAAALDIIKKMVAICSVIVVISAFKLIYQTRRY